jgi:glycosyltransferase involved in cell wall biosynthesis
MNPSISIVIPSYNYGRFIERAILSALKQDYSGPLQIVVADGGSTDDTVSVLKRYDDRIVWWSRKDSGFVEAVQRGMAVATGQIIGILSADDYYLAGALSKAATALVRHPEAGFIAGREVIVEEDGEVVCVYGGSSHADPQAILFEVTPPQNATFFRRSCYDRVGGVRRLSDNDTAADIDLWYRIAHEQPGWYVPDLLAVQQNHQGQMTRGPHRFDANLVRMVEACESDPQYGRRYQISAADRRRLYEYWELFWPSRTAMGRAGALRKAREVLEDGGAHDERTLELAKRLIGAHENRHVPIWQRVIKAVRERRLTTVLRRRSAALLAGRRYVALPAELNGVDLDWWR